MDMIMDNMQLKITAMKDLIHFNILVTIRTAPTDTLGMLVLISLIF